MSSQRATARGVGLAVAVPKEIVLTAAAEVERNGYDSFWLNNPPGTDALSVLGEVASLTTALQLGVGVIPLSSRDPEQIVRDAQGTDVPLERLYLGVGSGAGAGGLQRVEAGIHTLRSAFGGHIVVAALGPNMCRLAGAMADGVLFNWLTPAHAAQSLAWVEEGAADAGRPLPRTLAYVRLGLGNEAIARMRGEASTYQSYPAYAAHFKRMGTDAMDTTIAATGPDDIGTALAAWDGLVDEVVVRLITAHDTAEEILHSVEAARPT